MLLTAHVERQIIWQGLAGLVDPAPGREHLPGQYQRLRAAARFGEATVDQKLIYPLFHLPIVP